jgi:hypothetical protein
MDHHLIWFAFTYEVYEQIMRTGHCLNFTKYMHLNQPAAFYTLRYEPNAVPMNVLSNTITTLQVILLYFICSLGSNRDDRQGWTNVQRNNQFLTPIKHTLMFNGHFEKRFRRKNRTQNKQKTPWPVVRKRNIQTERPPRMWEWMYRSTFSWPRSASRPGVRASGTHSIAGCVESVWTSCRRENSLPYRDSNSYPSVVQPLASPYTDDTPAPPDI